MELSRKEAPIYGQVEAHALLQDLTIGSEEAEFYVVLEGSRLTHVTVVRKRRGESRLWFTVPGHNIPEVVSVTLYYSEDDGVHPCRGTASLQYVSDVPQEVADYLNINKDQLDPQSYLEVRQMYSTRWRGGRNQSRDPDEEPSSGQSDHHGNIGSISPEEEFGLVGLDEKITQAMANMDVLQQWTDGRYQPNGDRCSNTEAEPQPDRETLLHLAVRQDWLHLSRFLLHQPKGHRSLSLPNQEGDTPIQLAQRREGHTLFRVLGIPPGSESSHAAGGYRCLWSDRSGVLRFHSGTDHVTLTVSHLPGSRPQDVVLFLREKLSDPSILRMITVINNDDILDESCKEEVPASAGDLCEEFSVEEHGLIDSVFTEQLVLSLEDEEDEESVSSPPVPGDLMQSSCVSQDQSAQRASPAGSSHPTDSGQPSAAEGERHGVGGATTDSTATEGDARDGGRSQVPPPATDAAPPPGPPPPPPLGPSLPADSPSSNGAASNPTSRRESPTLDAYDLSPGLVALEVDSEEDGPAATAARFPDPPAVIRSGGDGMDAFRPSPDLTCTRTKSDSAAWDSSPSQELCNEGIRLRSYSYSSAKVSARPSRIARDGPPSLSPDGVFHNFSYSRSLLQALSLSKSLSLLHPGKQRVSNLPEQPQEKREIRVCKRAQSADDEVNVGLAESLQHLTLSEFLKEIEEEEFDTYNIPSKTDSDKYKVIRTFSFLKSRMSSTRNKSKGKGKDREAKDRQLNGHHFATGSCLGPTVCLICEKPASGRNLLHCSRCMSMVHKGCKESMPPCLKKPQDKYEVSMVKNKTASLPQNFTVRDSPPLCVRPNTMSLPVINPKERKDSTSLLNPHCGSVSTAGDRQSESSETESDSWRVFSQSDELQQTAASSTSTDSSIGEDSVDAYVSSDLAAGAVDFEAESWSMTVAHEFSEKQDKREVKRQDVIYELMQTEIHHLQTLHIMAEVFRRGMREEVQLETEAVERVFPCLDALLSLHHAFFTGLRERRHCSARPPEHADYLIERIGDVLLHQFSGENAERMKQVYGEFCSHQNDAVGFFKELQQNNKRFQNFVKQQSNNSLVRRREIPECILLVTQRITKYPVLLERILKYTQEDTPEHADLLKALALIRELVTAVDLSVSEHEQGQRLQEVWNRMENRSSAKLKNGHVFRKQDMMRPGQVLKHQGLLLWKTATGRLKDVLALLLTDTLIFLQEKDQKNIFAAVDQKPPVISLQKLIVREVANEERGMFLISASAAGPEMYEVHTSSKDERNTWMRLIREAVESCPEEEEEYTSESEDEKRAAEARIQKIHKLQESLMNQDQQICSSLEEKLQLYAELFALNWRTEASPLESRVLVRPHPDEVPQGSALLAAAVQETEVLKATLMSGSPARHAASDSVFPPSPLTPQPPPPASEAPCEEPEGGQGEWTTRAITPEDLAQWPNGDPNDRNLKVAQSVQILTQLLYSLQAAVTIQDSTHEVQRFLLLGETGRPSPCGQRPAPGACPRGHALQEQEKQRSVEKRREEAAAATRLHRQLRQERQRWEKECRAREGQQGEQRARLEERERRVRLQAETLRRERAALDEQLQEHQQSLELLRQGQLSVERERTRLDTQKRLLHSWRTPAAMVIPLHDTQVGEAGRASDYDPNDSVFVNEAVFTGTSVNNRQRHRGGGDDPSAHNSLNALLMRSDHGRRRVSKPPGSSPDLPGRAAESGRGYRPADAVDVLQETIDVNAQREDGEQLSPTATGADQHPRLLHFSDPQLDLNVLVSLETESEEAGREENIVYL